MPSRIGHAIPTLDTPQLLLDLDVLDTNLAYLQHACGHAGKRLRVHFKSLKCGQLARYLQARGVTGFLAAKVNEAEVLVAAGQRDVYVANQVVGSQKLQRLVNLAREAKIRVCVDDADNVRQMARHAREAGVTLEALVEVDIGMSRCGVESADDVVRLARAIQSEKGLRFIGLQAYDGHLQLLADREQKQSRCLEGLDRLALIRAALEGQGIAVEVVTGAGTGTWEWSAEHPVLTELQPGSFLLMDVAYHAVRPEFACALSVVATVVSRRHGWYVLDAGSKAISQDFGKPTVKDRPEERLVRLSEEHARVEDDGVGPKVGEQRQVLPAHCCATMNLHRTVLGVRKGVVEAEWAIEASGRYD